jgi:ubiquinone/menaquinone biosynthesis C-methylase UbiE
MNRRPASFDLQADTFDRRAGLPVRHCQAIAQAVLRCAGARPGDLLLEVGAGTGMLGIWLARSPLRYMGVDLSYGMLAAFQQRSGGQVGPPRLLQADANHPWPLAEATVRIIFSSRALHLLDLAHVVDESFRVAHPDGAVLIIGQMRRPADSLSSIMQQEMRRILCQYGFTGRDGKQHRRQLLAAFEHRGARGLDPVVVVRWTVTRTPWQVLENWASKPGLAGLDLCPAAQRVVLDELRRWAQAAFGDLHGVISYEEAYVLQGVRLSSTA